MKNTNIVSSLVVRASESHGSPAWTAEALKILSVGGEKVTLEKSMVTAPEDEDEENMEAYALFTCATNVTHVFFSGKSVVSPKDTASTLVAFLKKYLLDIEFGVYKGKLGILLTTDCELHSMDDLA